MSIRIRNGLAAACLSLFGFATVLLGGAPTAAGEVACVNEALRTEQHSTFLPDCRAYELVSPPDKNGGEVVTDLARTRAATDGGALAFSSVTAFGDIEGTGIAAEYLSRRSASAEPGGSGWTTHGVTPAQLPTPLRATFDSYEPQYWYLSPDLENGVFQAWSHLTKEPLVELVPNLYLRSGLRSDSASPFSLASACALCAETAVPLESISESQEGMVFPFPAAATPDGGEVLFESALMLTAAASDYSHVQSNRGLNLYVGGSGSIQLVDLIPPPGAAECTGGGCAVAAEGAEAGSGAMRNGTNPNDASSRFTPHVLSADGSRAIFTANPNLTGAECKSTSATRRCFSLYLRDLASQTTFQVSASERTDCADHHPCTGAPEPDPAGRAPARYWDATPDGTRVFFTTAEKLTDDDTNTQPDLYMYDLSAPVGQRLTLLGSASGDASVVGLGGDGHYLYFTSTEPLVAGQPPLDSKGLGLFLWHDGAGIPAGGELRYLGETHEQIPQYNSVSPAGNSMRVARVSADGTHLLFASYTGRNLLGNYGGEDADQDSGQPVCPSGFFTAPLPMDCHELYLYDATTDQLHCVSCPPSGTLPNGSVLVGREGNIGVSLGSAAYEDRSLAEGGRYVFFSTRDALLSADTDGATDAYEYDAGSGEVHLLSSGTSESNSYFMDASADGHDAFIATRQRLLGWDHDSGYDVYDVRVDGGFLEPVPAPAPCGGESCRPLATPAPPASAAASAALIGPGNPLARRSHRKHSKHRSHHKHRRHGKGRHHHG